MHSEIPVVGRPFEKELREVGRLEEGGQLCIHILLYCYTKFLETSNSS